MTLHIARTVEVPEVADGDGPLLDDLGLRLREARLRSRLSLRQLAHRTGVSASFVSQMEHNRAQPSVATLYAFSRILGISIDELFDQQSRGTTTEHEALPQSRLKGRTEAWRPSEYANRVSIVHPAHRSQLRMAAGVVWERLAATPEPGVNFVQISYEPGAASTEDGGRLSHEGYEYGYVLHGVIEVSVSREVFVLRQGESLGFDSSLPHVLRNVGTETFHGIWFDHTSTH